MGCDIRDIRGGSELSYEPNIMACCANHLGGVLMYV